MPGPAPKKPDERRRRNAPAGGEWKHAPGDGWLHGKVPAAPTSVGDRARAAWDIWFGSWPASFWSPLDLPQLEVMVDLLDKIHRDAASSSERVEWRQLMDRFGLFPAAQQKLRWLPPVVEEAPGRSTPKGGHYKGLRAV